MTLTDNPVFLHNFHELNEIGRIYYQVAVRPNWPARRQFFFEGCRDLMGQMYIADRMALYDAILKYRPRQCFEVGTFTGGGSTFFLASAFQALGEGRVITLEADANLHQLASGYYKRYLPALNEHVTFLHGTSVQASFEPLIDRERGVDCLFLDGAEDAGETHRQYEFFRRHLRPGSVLMAHDWETDKLRITRAVLESSPDWHRERVISEPDSVGFALYIYRPVNAPAPA